MTAQHILLILNPVSGKMKSRPGLFDILDELYHLPDGTPASDRRVTVCTTLYRGHATELASAAVAEGYDRVLCCGGDGTLNEVLNGLMHIPPENRPTLGYIPAGSTNDFAASIGLPSTLRAAARVAGGKESFTLDIGEFCPADGGNQRFFSYIASFGAFTETSYATSQTAKNVMGHVAYVLGGIRDIANIAPCHLIVEMSDGTRLEGEYVFGAMSNTTSAGGMVKLPPDRVSLTDGELEVFLIRKPRTPSELNRIIGSLLASNYSDNPMIDFLHAKHARFTFPEPTVWSLDGEEAAGGSVVDIYCHPGAVSLIREG